MLLTQLTCAQIQLTQSICFCCYNVDFAASKISTSWALSLVKTWPNQNLLCSPICFKSDATTTSWAGTNLSQLLLGTVISRLAQCNSCHRLITFQHTSAGLQNGETIVLSNYTFAESVLNCDAKGAFLLSGGLLYILLKVACCPTEHDKDTTKHWKQCLQGLWEAES